MKLRRSIIIGVAVMATLLVPSVASAEVKTGRGRFLSLPPDLTTEYLQGHYPHRDPLHPDASYRHRRLATATDHGVDRFTGQVETIPAGDFCEFAVDLRQWGKIRWWDWTDEQGNPVHSVANPQLVNKFSANGRSFWTIDEGWDYVWSNPDGTDFVEGTGTHLWIHDKHRKFRQYGTWHLVFGPEGLLYDKYFRDRTSVWDGTRPQAERKLCEFLAPAGR